MGDEIEISPGSLEQWMRNSYDINPEGMDGTFVLAFKEAISRYAIRLDAHGVTELEIEGVSSALAHGSEVVLKIKELISEHIGEGEIAEHTLGLLVTQLASAIRFDPKLVKSERYQEVITDAFATVTDISSLASTEFYLGRTPITPDANQAVAAYFNAVELRPSLHAMQTAVTPVHMILYDWGAAVGYCRNQGVPKEAFLRDGTNLFRFSPDALPYVDMNRRLFPNLELRKVNNGEYVESWLASARIGRHESAVPIESWLVLLTGYTPKDNKAIPGLNERYSAALVSTALDVQNRRL